MRTNIVLDDELTDEAFELTGLKTKRELVELALKELVKRKRDAQKKTLQDAFAPVQRLSNPDSNNNDTPFPDTPRRERTNPFAESL